MLEESLGRQIFERSHLCQNELAIQGRQLLDCVSGQHSWTEMWNRVGGKTFGIWKSPPPLSSGNTKQHEKP